MIRALKRTCAGMDLLSSEAYIGLTKRNDARANTLLHAGFKLYSDNTREIL